MQISYHHKNPGPRFPCQLATLEKSPLTAAYKEPLKTDELKAIQAVFVSNVFSSTEEKEKVSQMAAIAKLMYDNPEKVEAIDSLFPSSLLLLPTPADLGLELPKGLSIQAYRHEDEIMVAIRGTELGKDSGTLLQNLIADLGIGRHKSNEDLLDSLKTVNSELKEMYGIELDPTLLKSMENLLNARVQGHDDTSRALELTRRVGYSAIEGGVKGSVIGGAGGAILGGLALLVGLTAPPLAIVFAGASASAGMLLGSGAKAVVETAVCSTVMDGYPVLISYIKAGDRYIEALKENGNIRKTDTVPTIGHSLAGYLAGVLGALHADDAYAFNGPGVLYDIDMKEIIRNLGLERSVKDLVHYHSFSMATDFIGNLGKREGSLQKLVLPITFSEPIGDFPSSYYDSPLSHHGISILSGVLNNSSVLPVARFRRKVKEKEEPRFEEIL